MILYSTVRTSLSAGIVVRAAYPPALSAIAAVAPAWTYPCCWLTSALAESLMRTSPCSISLSQAPR